MSINWHPDYDVDGQLWRCRPCLRDFGTWLWMWLAVSLGAGSEGGSEELIGRGPDEAEVSVSVI